MPSLHAHIQRLFASVIGLIVIFVLVACNISNASEISSSTPSNTDLRNPNGPNSSFRRVAYYDHRFLLGPNHAGVNNYEQYRTRFEEINWTDQRVTHLMYMPGIAINKDGNFTGRINPENTTFTLPDEPTNTGRTYDQQMRYMIQQWHAKGIRVYLVLSTPCNGKIQWVHVGSRPEKLARLIRNTKQLVQNYGFDGVDIDFEQPYIEDENRMLPIGCGSSERANLDVENAYKAPYNHSAYVWRDIVAAFHREFTPLGKTITAAVTPGVMIRNRPQNSVASFKVPGLEQTFYISHLPNDGAAIDLASVNRLEFLNIMVYDAEGPLSGNTPAVYAPNELLRESFNYWANTRGFPKDKLVLGMPFYVKNAENLFEGYPYRGLFPRQNRDVTLQNIRTRLYDAIAHPGKYGLPNVSVNAYFAYPAMPGQREFWYNDADSVWQKTQCAKTMRSGGVMMFELAYDVPSIGEYADYSLLNHVYWASTAPIKAPGWCNQTGNASTN